MSLLGCFVRPQSLSASSKRASAMLIEAYRTRPRRARCADVANRRDNTKHQSYNAADLERVFVQSLVAAGSCSKHSPRNLKRRSVSLQQTRSIASKRDAEQSAHKEYAQDITQEELKRLVNTYNDGTDAVVPKDPSRHYRLASRLVMSAEEEDRLSGKRVIIPPEDTQHAVDLRNFNEQLKRKLGQVNLAALWELYQGLRPPQVRYVPDISIRRFFRHLAWVRYKHETEAKQRYISFLYDCVEAGVNVIEPEWNSAIAYAGLGNSRATTADMQAALEMWLRMEQANAPSKRVTFNILFHVAVRTGRYALADTIFEEMKAREIEFDRYHHTTLIWYAGTRRDGDAVRKAFRDLVNSGQLVDTTVMNCVMVSLIRAGEPASAEDVFSRMKSLHKEKLGLAGPGDWPQARFVNRKLVRMENELRAVRRKHESSFFGAGFSAQSVQEEVQRQVPIGPDSHSYAILIKHHAQVSGDLHRIQELLQEMKGHEIVIEGKIYTVLFQAFVEHGGQRYTLWDPKSLMALYEEFMQEVKHSKVAKRDRLDSIQNWRPSITFPSTRAILRAFYKCMGSQKMVEVWKELLSHEPQFSQNESAQLDKLIQRYAFGVNIYQS